MQRWSRELGRGALAELCSTVPFVSCESASHALLLSVPEIESLPQDRCDGEAGFRKMCEATFGRAALWPSSSPKTSVFSSLWLEPGAPGSSLVDFKSKGRVMMGHLHNSRHCWVKHGVKNERNPVVSGVVCVNPDNISSGWVVRPSPQTTKPRWDS